MNSLYLSVDVVIGVDTHVATHSGAVVNAKTGDGSASSLSRRPQPLCRARPRSPTSTSDVRSGTSLEDYFGYSRMAIKDLTTVGAPGSDGVTLSLLAVAA